MLYKKTGFPEEDELVICTVASVQNNSVFADLDEYSKRGLIHISEIAPGRIRNIRDYVVEGKKVICKILKVDKEKGHIDLSLRRVSEPMRRAKLDDIKQEQKAEKIVEFLAKKLNLDVKKTYDQVTSKLFDKYPNLHSCFEDVVAGKKVFEKLGLDDKLASLLAETVIQRIKPAEVEITGEFKISCHQPDGVEIIKDALKKAESVNKGVSVYYLGAGRYKVSVKAPEYKTAEKILKDVVDKPQKIIEKAEGTIEFSRDEK